MAQDRHVLCAMALAHATVVFPKADIEPPLEPIFYTPVFPHRLGEPDDIPGQGGQEKPLLTRDLPAHLAMGLDEANAGDVGPRALHPSARDSRCDPSVAGFQATMIRVHGRMLFRGDMVQAVRFDVLKQALPLTMEGRMIVLQGQNVIGALLRNGLGHFFLTPHRIDRHKGTLQLHHP